MYTITPEGTARQICMWLGVPDPSIKPVMKALALEPTQVFRREVEEPVYNTADAFICYHRVTHLPLPPEARLFLGRTLLAQQNAPKAVVAPPPQQPPPPSPPMTPTHMPTSSKKGSVLWPIAAFLKDKELDGCPIDPADYDGIERTLNLEYALRPTDGLRGVKLYSLRNLQRAWKMYVQDCS